LVAITVGAQKFDDHRPKMMQAINSAAAQVDRAWSPANSAVTDTRSRDAWFAGSGMLLRRYAINSAGAEVLKRRFASPQIGHTSQLRSPFAQCPVHSIALYTDCRQRATRDELAARHPNERSGVKRIYGRRAAVQIA
jgi:hypothetical protein